MELFKLFGSIFIEDEDANKKLDKIDKKASGVGQKLLNMGKTALKGTAILAGGAAAAGAAVMGFANKTAASADRIDKLSQRLGLSREGFQEWDFIMSQAGVTIDSMQMGMKNLSQRMNDALTGAGKGAELFDELGVKIEEGMSQEEAFEKTVTALQNMEDGIKKADLAQKLFGRNGQDLLPLLNGTAESTEELRKKAHELGLVLGDNAVDAGVAFTDNMDRLKRSLAGEGNQIIGGFLPVINQLVELVIANIPTVKDMFESVFSTMIPLVTELGSTLFPILLNLFSNMSTDVLPLLIDLFAQFAQGVLPLLLELFNQVTTDILPVFLDILNVLIKNVLPPLLDLFEILITKVLPPIIKLFSEVISKVLPPFISLFEEVINQVLPIIMELFEEFTKTVLPPLMELIDEIVAQVLPPLIEAFNEISKVVLPLMMSIFKELVPVIKPIMNTIAAVIRTVLALIKGDWQGAWNGIKDIFVGVWDTIKTSLKGSINIILKGLNALIRGLNKIKFDIPDWVPGIGGKEFGISIPQLPLLAKGGEVQKS